MENYLFVYGTLRKGVENSYSNYLKKNSQFIGNAHFEGLLFNLGYYPGAVYQKGGSTLVYGDVFFLNEEKLEDTLEVLDNYEMIEEATPHLNEYKRAKVPVFLNEKWVDCFVYLYNLEFSSFPIIESGDYLKDS